MLIETSVACAIAAAIAWKAKRGYEERRYSQRREQLLIQALHEASSDLSITRNLRLSDRQFEMELLLMQLSSKAEMLMAALAFEADSGEKALATETGSPFGLGQWQEARRAVEQAQGVYSESLDAFHEFLHSLPPPLRAKASERGALAMAISPA